MGAVASMSCSIMRSAAAEHPTLKPSDAAFEYFSSPTLRFMATKRRGPKSPMTDEHKAALAAGPQREPSRQDLPRRPGEHLPKRGRRRTPESIKRRLVEIDESSVDADPLSRLNLIQERMDLHDELETMDAKVDLTALEDDFVAVAHGYSSRPRYLLCGVA